MKFSKSLKGLLILVPFILVGCSSSKTTDEYDGYGSGTTTTDRNVSGISTGEYGSGSSNANRSQLDMLRQENIVYFDFDRSDIRPEFIALLDQHAEYLRNNSVNAVIEGHADERGTPEYNIALGERRAKAVKSYLQGRGVSPQQLSIVSYGKEKPAVLGHSESAYAKNRRAVVVY